MYQVGRCIYKKAWNGPGLGQVWTVLSLTLPDFGSWNPTQTSPYLDLSGSGLTLTVMSCCLLLYCYIW